MFVHLHKSNLKFCDPLGGFFEFNGKYWEKLHPGLVKKYSMDVYENLIMDLTNFTGDDTQKGLLATHVKNTGNVGKLEAMIDCSKPDLYEPAENFDSNPYLFNCNNGTINLKTFKFQPHSSADLITKISKVDFLKDAQCPTWIKFVNDIFLGREEIIDFIQRYLGYSLTPFTKEQCMCIFNGDGRNGKSTFIETIRQIFNDYAGVCPTSTLIVKRDEHTIPNDIASLKGCRLVSMIETNQNVTLDEGCIKKLTGSDMLKVRFLHKEFFEFMPTFKIIFSSNHKPNIRGTDNGIWRRIRMIPFDFKVEDNNDDRELPLKLKEELPGILKWIIEGYKKYHESGLPTPASIMDTTEEYKEEEDSIGQFIEDECDIEEKTYVTIKNFKERIYQYNKYLLPKAINEYMRKKGWNPKKNRLYIDGQQTRCYIGVCFKNGLKKHIPQDQQKWED